MPPQALRLTHNIRVMGLLCVLLCCQGCAITAAILQGVAQGMRRETQRAQCETREEGTCPLDGYLGIVEGYETTGGMLLTRYRCGMGHQWLEKY